MRVIMRKKRVEVFMDIAKIDRNFQIEANIGEADAVFYDVRCEPFCVFGLYH